MNFMDKRIVLCIAAFVILTIYVLWMPLSELDKNVSSGIQNHLSVSLKGLMSFVSWFGVMPYSLITPLCVVIAFAVFKFKREALFTLCTLLAGLVSTLVKYLVNRPRPAEPWVHVLEPTAQQSFPSGHVNFYVVFFGFLIVLMYQLKTVPKLIRILASAFCLFLILLVGISRIYLGAHWFTDVLGGYLLGAVLLHVNCYFYFKKAG